VTLDELKALAKKATPELMDERTQRYLEAVDPKTVLALIARVEALSDALRVYAEMDDWGYGHDVGGDCNYGAAAQLALAAYGKERPL
jgi:hypothetical protein